MRTRRWGYKYGNWWLLQYIFDGTFSLGIHIDPKTRMSDKGRYGPYVDFHLIAFAISIGFYPSRSLNDSIMRPEHY